MSDTNATLLPPLLASRMMMMLSQLRYMLSVLITVVAMSAATTADAAIVYQITPVTLSNGFAVAGGSITTDGSVGDAFSKSSIVDYE
ncbi:MAG: hypothetical protein MI741_15490, partial [Rhodospirillales bacterium]|nr:hypothetical protein [Rhodospirillales bacterium]